MNAFAMSVFSVATATLATLLQSGCAKAFREPDLGAIYNEAAQNIGDARNPVVVIPGVLGTRLAQEDASGRRSTVWGAFVAETVDAETPAGARTVALPMEVGTPLADLRDDVKTDGVLDRLELDLVLLRGLKLSAYVDILATLAAGEYRDDQLGEAGAIDYGGAHYTCFQFPYDWRRDISEHAEDLHDLIIAAKRANPRYEQEGEALKVDVVAHSMGGLLLRYYLRYGPNPIGPNGEIPPLTWAGARHVENAILVATPNAGSVQSLEQLVEGVRFAPFTPRYRAELLGTMPAIYQLLPRTRHARIVDLETGRPLDLYDIETWKRYGWGLAADEPSPALRWLLPDATSDAERRAVALDHLEKSLRAARAFHRAIDRPAAPPDGTRLHIFAGDTFDTPAVMEASPNTGWVRIRERSPGDGTVTRRSALMDERTGAAYAPFLRTPIAWHSAVFLQANHLGLTREPAFTNNLLFLLLERPDKVGPAGPPEPARREETPPPGGPANTGNAKRTAEPADRLRPSGRSGPLSAHPRSRRSARELPRSATPPLPKQPDRDT